MKKIYNLVSLVLLMVLGYTTQAQDQFERRYPLQQTDVITSAMEPVGEGYVTIGVEINQQDERDNMNLVFFNSKGNIDQSVSFFYRDTVANEEFFVAQAGDVIRFDNNFIISAILDKDSENKAISLINQGGSIAWTVLTGKDGDTKDLRSSQSLLLELPDQKILHSHVVSGANNTTDIQLTRLNIFGEIEHTNTFGLELPNGRQLNEDFIQMQMGLDSMIMILGTTDDPNRPFFLSKMDTLNNVLWTKTYNGDFGRLLDNQGYDLVQLKDETWAIFGSVLPDGGTMRNEGVLLHLDNNGNPLLTETIRTTSPTFQLYPNGIVTTLDTTVIFSMVRENMITDDLNPLIVSYNLDSIIGYQTLLDTCISTDPNMVELVTVDSISATYMTTTSKDGNDIPYLAKVDENGTTQCEETDMAIIIDSVNFIVSDITAVTDTFMIVQDSVFAQSRGFNGYTPPILSLQDTTYCPQDQINYFVDGTVRGGVTYEWDDGIDVPERIFTEEGMFMLTVTVREDLCFTLCDTLTITQLMFPEVAISKNDNNFCTTGDIILNAVVSGASASSFEWSTGETEMSIVVDGNLIADYSVVIMDDCGNSATASTSITEADQTPPVEGSIDFSCGNPGQLTLTGSGFSRIEWSTGELESIINITTPGTYSVTLFDQCDVPMDVVDPIEVSAEDLDDCTTCDNPCLIWPNALYPEDPDPDNKVFGPAMRTGCNSTIVSFEMKIFNRWGKNVYTSNDITNRWNGAINGDPQPGGVYYYWAQYNDGTTTCERKGDLTLLR